jgi:hypothetical protein
MEEQPQSSSPWQRHFVKALGTLYIFFFATNSQAQVLERNNTNYGTNRVFSYSVQSSYGVNTSANASPNLKVETEAILNLKEDSQLTNKAGAVGGGTGAVFQNTPNGSNVQLTGITADNIFLIDSGTQFRAALTTTEVDGQPSIGNASATASHSLTVTVNNGETSFFNTLRQNFEGAQ